MPQQTIEPDIDPGHAIDELRGISPEETAIRQALGDDPTDAEREKAILDAGAGNGSSSTDEIANGAEQSNSDRQQGESAKAEGAGGSAFNRLQSSVTGQLTQEEVDSILKIDPNRLVEIPGRGVVPFHRAVASMMLKDEYDRESGKLENERIEVRKDKDAIGKALPIIDKLLEDDWGKHYASILFDTNDPEKARRGADAIMGWGHSAQAEQGAAAVAAVDSRTIAPKDDDGSALDEEDPRYLKWLAGPYADYRSEQAAKKAVDEMRSEFKQREDKVASERAAEQAQSREATELEMRYYTHNEGVLKSLPQVVLDQKGIDIAALSPQQTEVVFSQIAAAAKSFGKDLVNDNFLKTDVLTSSDIVAAVLKAPFTRDSLLANITGIPKSTQNGAGNGQGAASQSFAGAANLAETQKPLSAGAESRGAAPAQKDLDNMDPDDLLSGALNELRSDKHV